jgi:alpha-glucosidase
LIPYTDKWWGGEGSFIDFTNPQARTKWKNMLKDYLILRGASSIWNDNNEYSSIDNGAARCTYEYEKCGEN